MNRLQTLSLIEASMTRLNRKADLRILSAWVVFGSHRDIAELSERELDHEVKMALATMGNSSAEENEDLARRYGLTKE